MLTEMVEDGHKIARKVKAVKSEIKENIWGTNSERKETGTQINGVDQKEERNIQPEQNEKTRIQKNEERVRTVSYTHLTLPTSLAECRSRWSPYH